MLLPDCINWLFSISVLRLTWSHLEAKQTTIQQQLLVNVDLVGMCVVQGFATCWFEIESPELFASWFPTMMTRFSYFLLSVFQRC